MTAVAACLAVTLGSLAEAAELSEKGASSSGGAASKSKSVTVVSKSAETGSKIDSLLAAIRTAESFRTIADAFLKLKLTDKELEKLEADIKAEGLDKKIEALKQAEKTKPSKTGIATQATGHKIDFAAAKSNLALKQIQKIQELDINAEKLRTGKSVGTTMMNQGSIAGRISSLKIAVPKALAGDIPIPQSSVKFTSLEPHEGVIGQSLTIEGSGFGNAQGSVTIAIGAPGSSHREAWNCPVTSWTSWQIVITVPTACESRVTIDKNARFGIVSEHAWLLVSPAGDAPGAFREFSVTLDRDRFKPTITSLSSNDIRPGQLMVVTGANFKLDGTKPTVKFIFDEKTFDVEPRHVEETSFDVRLPDNIEGMLPTAGQIEVKNLTDLVARQTVSFVPLEEIVELISDEKDAHCVVPHPFIFCWVGEAYQPPAMHDWTLKNGWVVEDFWLETRTSGINSGAYYTREPQRGGTVAGSRFEIWADAYSRAYTKEHFYLRGPKGTFNQSH